MTEETVLRKHGVIGVLRVLSLVFNREHCTCRKGKERGGDHLFWQLRLAIRGRVVALDSSQLRSLRCSATSALNPGIGAMMAMIGEMII
jgi:hypothetical protein